MLSARPNLDSYHNSQALNAAADMTSDHLIESVQSITHPPPLVKLKSPHLTKFTSTLIAGKFIVKFSNAHLLKNINHVQLGKLIEVLPMLMTMAS